MKIDDIVAELRNPTVAREDNLYLGRWKITFEAEKGTRMTRYFRGAIVTESGPCGPYWWHHDRHCYSRLDGDGHFSTRRHMRTFKAFKRHLRRHCKALPVGSRLCLRSEYVGHDVIAERVK